MQKMIGEMGQYNIGPVNIDSLADIRDVKIDASLPVEERKKQYLRQIRNPYCYRCGDVVVRVSFADTGVTLEDRLKQYLLSGGGPEFCEEHI